MAYGVKGFGVYHAGDVYVCLKGVSPCLQLFLDTGSLPFKPIGDVRIFCVSLHGGHAAKLGQLVHLAAGVTGQMDAKTLCLTFSTAGGTFVEQTLQTVGAEGLCDLDAVFVLPCEVFMLYIIFSIFVLLSSV